MKFQSFVCMEIEQEQNLNALNLEVPFSQKDTIEANKAYIFDNFKLDNIKIVNVDEEVEAPGDTKQQREQARVGKPIAYFF